MPVWIKRALCATLLLALLAGGLARAEDALRGYTAEEGYVYVRFGTYPQQADGGREPILWRVLTADDERVWLLSEYILFARAMHTSLSEYQKEFKGDYAQTELCRYLNTTFLADAFTGAEQEALLPFGDCGRVFILSTEDLNDRSIGLGVTLRDSRSEKKIRQNPGVRAWGTAWALQHNGYSPEEYPNPRAKIRNAAGTANVTVAEKRLFAYSADRGGVSPYWTRTQSGADRRHANCTKANGTIGHMEVGRDNEGVRPAVYLAAGSVRIAGGLGTREDPFVLEPAAAAPGETESSTETGGEE